MPDQNPVQTRHGSSIGQPLTRREGLLKVTGSAHFAADNHPKGMLYAALCTSGIARGRVIHLDVDAAKAHPLVVDVMVPGNTPQLACDPDGKDSLYTFRMELLQNNRVRYANQAIAVVIAETLESATEGVTLLAPQYQAEPARVGLNSTAHFVPETVGEAEPADADNGGDIESGLTGSAKRLVTTYETPAQYHNAMEPHAIVAQWEGDKLIVDMPSQALAMGQGRIAQLLGIDPSLILIRSPFLGGGFGSKAFVKGPQILGIMAAKMVGRPVKLVLRRDQMFGPVGHRAPTRQTLRIGTDAEGQIQAVHHHSHTATSTFDEFFEPSAKLSHTLYAAPALKTTHTAVRLDTGTPLFMRGPGEASGSIALEGAIDEMAEACGMDPLGLSPEELRRGGTHFG